MEFKMTHALLATVTGIFISLIFKSYIIFLCIVFVILLAGLFFICRKSSIMPILLISALFFLSAFRYFAVSNYDNKLKKNEGKQTDIKVIVVEKGNQKNINAKYIVEPVDVKDSNIVFKKKEKLILKSNNKDYKVGDIVEARGIFEDIIGKRNFGDNDINLYYKSIGIYNSFSSFRDKKIGESKDFKILLFNKVRDRIEYIIKDSLPEKEAAFLSTVIIGDKHGLDDDEKDNYSKVGLSHILSISGLHVAFIVLLIKKFLEVLKIKDTKGDIVCSVIITYYVIMIGAPPPALRSLIMMLILIWGKHLNKEYDMLSACSLAAIVMLLFNPLFIYNQGFVISFACIYSIGLFYEPFYKAAGKICAIAFIRKSIALSLSIQIGIIPILVYYFNYISLVSILINIFIIPFVFIIIAIGFIGVVVASVIPYFGLYIFSLDYYFINIISKIIGEIATWDIAGVYIPSMPLYIYILYYLFVAVALFRDRFGFFYPKIRKYTIPTIFLVVILLFLCKNIFNDNIRLVFLDVGQGDSSIITTSKGKHVLIDGGGSVKNNNYYYDVGGKITVPALLKLGIWRIDTIIVSHIHEDHMEGLLKVAEHFRIGKIIMPDVPYESDLSLKFIDVCRKKGINIMVAKNGDRLIFDKSTYIDILFPEKQLIKATKSDENNNSIVAKLNYKDFKVLYTGDIEKEGESRLLTKNIKADIIKIPHHGSNTSSSEEFIKAVSPKASVISVGKNIFGHPSKETIKRLSAVSDAIYRTDTMGAICIKSDGKKITIKSVREYEEN